MLLWWFFFVIFGILVRGFLMMAYNKPKHVGIILEYVVYDVVRLLALCIKKDLVSL